MMRRMFLILSLPAVCWAAPTSQPVAVPYQITDSNHIVIRLKINGKGPYHFIVDTGAPAMILSESIGKTLGLKVDGNSFATLNKLEIEGGITLNNVQCLVTTPYQIEGMNAIGAAGLDLDGLLGYPILARFRMQIDLSKDRMQWTLLDYKPPIFHNATLVAEGRNDPDEDKLEFAGPLLKVLGPLIKPTVLASTHRGVIGIELIEQNGRVCVQRVLGSSPADKAGIKLGDRLLAINKKPLVTVNDAENAASGFVIGKPIDLLLKRNGGEIKVSVITGEGL